MVQITFGGCWSGQGLTKKILQAFFDKKENREKSKISKYNLLDRKKLK